MSNYALHIFNKMQLEKIFFEYWQKKYLIFKGINEIIDQQLIFSAIAAQKMMKIRLYEQTVR